MTDYKIEPDHRGVDWLWRYEDDKPDTPFAELSSTHGTPYRAAAAVLAPDHTVRKLIAQACGDPGSIVTRVPNESTSKWSARAVEVALKALATGGGQS